MILHLVRHPRPLIGAGICYGRLDVTAEDPQVIAASLRASLPSGVALWSSPLQRCALLARALSSQPLFDERLMEMDFGAWEGLPWDAVPRNELDAWAADVAGYAPPGGESPDDLRCRVLEFVTGLNEPEAILVTHAGVIRLLQAHVLGLPPSRWAELNFAYGSHTVIELSR